ncbi:hypothetical protein MLD38_029073 [Melastoma candidum]|uniref:Uncharacterized protein n=1 Tax=Melastoma candidum TaxID=119954 RepID=A0ACB9N738_9MYRT|nr:hypothetical protein MLD38_029073 [Melastoma candidum]
MASPPLSSSWHQWIMDAKRPAKKPKRTAEEPLVHARSKTAELSSPLRKGDHGNESGHPITSASPGKHDSIIRAKRTERRAGRNKGVLDALTGDDASKDDDVHNDLSLEQQLQMVVLSESTLLKRGIYIIILLFACERSSHL